MHHPEATLVRILWLRLRDCSGWNSTGRVLGMTASVPGLLDACESPRQTIEQALTWLYANGHVAHHAASGEWAVTTRCKPLPLTDAFKGGSHD